MKKILFVIIFVSGSLFAQNDEAKVAPSYNKMMIGMSFSPDYAYRTLKSDGSANYLDEIIVSRNKNEKAKLGCTFGINFNYNFNRKFGLITGVLISNKGYQLNSSNLRFGNVLMHSRRGFIVDPNRPLIPESVKQVLIQHYLDIPFKMIYTVGKGNTRFISSLGFISSFLIKSKTKSEITYRNGDYQESLVGSYENFKRLNLSASISIGVEKQFKNKSIIRVEPTFRYGLLDIIDAPITAKLWSAGLNVSYYLRLK
ncbi:MAG: outer membrane beta-barrel protein [Vicingaceae bacterium]